MVLTTAENGKWVRVVSFEGEHQTEFKLRQYGLIPGDRAKIMRQTPLGGPLLIEVNGRAIALGRSIASRIVVEELRVESPHSKV